MTEEEAEAALLALGFDLEWEFDQHPFAEPGYGMWEAEAAGYDFRVQPRAPGNLKWDLSQPQYQWKVTVWEFGDSWHCRCATPEIGKAICERLALTDDHCELESRLATNPILTWQVGQAREDIVDDTSPLREKAVAYIARDNHSWYEINHVRRWRLFPVYMVYKARVEDGLLSSNAPRPYPTMAQAQAACGRHYATREWD